MIDSLIAILRPPLNPLEVPEVPEWIKIERQVGTELPADYKAFIERYGTGSIADFIWIDNPWSKNKFLCLTERLRSLSGPMLEELLRLFPEELPFRVFPESNGLLPFGGTDNGEILAWETRGNNSDWNVLVMDTREPRYFRHPGNLASFLEQLLTGRIRCPIFRKDVLSGGRAFLSKPRHDPSSTSRTTRSWCFEGMWRPFPGIPSAW